LPTALYVLSLHDALPISAESEIADREASKPAPEPASSLASLVEPLRSPDCFSRLPRAGWQVELLLARAAPRALGQELPFQRSRTAAARIESASSQPSKGVRTYFFRSARAFSFS